MTGPTSVAGSVGSPSCSACGPLGQRVDELVGDVAVRRSAVTSTCTAARRCRTRRTARRRSASARSASGSTIIAFLPPSSRLTSRGPVAIASAATMRPVGTEPVKLTARTPGMHDERPTRLGVAVHDVDEPVGHPASSSAATNSSAHVGRVLGRLEHDAVAREQRGEALPRRDRDREVPRRDHPDDADRLARASSPSCSAAPTASSRPTRRARARRRSGPCRWPPARRRRPRPGSCRPRARRASRSRPCASARIAPQRSITSARAGAGTRAHSCCASVARADRGVDVGRRSTSGYVPRISAGRAGFTLVKVVPITRLLVAVGRDGLPRLHSDPPPRRCPPEPPGQRLGEGGRRPGRGAAGGAGPRAASHGWGPPVRAAAAKSARRLAKTTSRPSARPSTVSDPSGPKISTSVRLGVIAAAAGDRDLARRAALVVGEHADPAVAGRRGARIATTGPSAASTRSRMCGPTSSSAPCSTRHGDAANGPPRNAPERKHARPPVASNVAALGEELADASGAKR